jgi:chromatin modification-related protein VID21
MRVDFREERRWKIALAFNLVHAVMEWYEAGSLEERVRRGICVLWKRPRSTDSQEEGSQSMACNAVGSRQVDSGSGATSKAESTPVDNDNSDEDSDEEQEREQQDVIEALDPSNAVREAFEDAELQLENHRTPDIQPKLEYIEDSSALHRGASLNAMEVEPTSMNRSVAALPQAEPVEPTGLKLLSENPLLGTPDATGGTVSGSSKPKSKGSLFAPLREQIVFSDMDKLILDLDELDLVKSMSSLSTADAAMSVPPPLPDLAEIFPDMQTFGLLEVPPTTGVDGKKKSGRGDKDDPNKRTEDTTYMKVLPSNDFMYHRTTLIGTLQPSKHYHDGQWHDLDEAAVVVEHENTSSRPADESLGSGERRGCRPMYDL